jgi:hypothetical protein
MVIMIYTYAMDRLKDVSGCPSCGGALQVRELSCPVCEIAVRGNFPRCEFCALPAQQLRFLRLFVSRRGNLREVERELGVSYPTVRARLDDLLRALGYPVSRASAADRQERRRQILDNLKSGEMSPEQAARALRE